MATRLMTEVHDALRALRRRALGGFTRPVATMAQPSQTPRAPTPGQRGIDLLLANLTADQRAQYFATRHFDVTGGDSGKRYRLWHCFQQNIEELDASGRRHWVLCFHPAKPLVLGDVLLAQKTALELFERDALRIAHAYSDFAPTGGPDSSRACADFYHSLQDRNAA